MSIFNDKTLKGVAEAVLKVMQQEELKGNQHKIDANKNGEIDAHDFKLLKAKKSMKKEAVEQLDEKVMVFHSTSPGAKMQRFHKDSPAPGAQAHRDAAASAVKGLRAAGKIKSRELSQGGTDDIKTAKGGTVFAKNVREDTDHIDEAFPTVADAQKRMAAGKTSTGSVTSTKTGLVHKRDYKDDDAEEAQKKTKGYGARQNFKRSKRVNESTTFTEMLEMYSEYGIKVLAPIKTQEETIGDQTFQVLDADKFNGFAETTVEEEVTNDEFTKELKDQEASFEGKKKQPKVAAGKTTGVKEMPEEYELEERSLTSGEKSDMEKNVKGMKKGLSGFKDRYGERAKEVMYATATKMAKKD